MIHSSEKALKEHGDKVGAPEKEAIEQAVTALRSELEGEDAEAITTKTNDLMQASMKLGEAMYKASQEEAAHADAARDSARDDVIDADFKEVNKDDKKGA